LAEDKKRRGSFIIIDGKQRLLAIRQFAAPVPDEFEQLRLRALEERADLNGLTYEDLRSDLARLDDRTAFDNQTIRTVVIRGWDTEAYLYSVFLRINTGSVQLSPQELRQALHPGDFSDFIDEKSANSLGLQRALGLTEPDFRMRDAELLLRFFAYKNFADSYTGNLKIFMDETTERLNSTWTKFQATALDQLQSLEDALQATKDIFGEDSYLRKWNGANFERRINRAVYDIMTCYLSDPQVRRAALKAKTKIVDAFKRLCDTDADFRNSLERTTKSLEANRSRFKKWAEALSAITGRKVGVPLSFQ
jgi:hypothetical protein